MRGLKPPPPSESSFSAACKGLCSLRKLLLVEENEATAGVEAEAAARIGRHLERHGALHVLIGGGGHGQQVVRAYVCNHELVAADEADSVDARRKVLAADLQGHFGDEVSLVFGLNVARVAAGVHQGSKHVGSIRKF